MPRTSISLPILSALGALLAVCVCATPAAGQTAATLPAPPQARPVGPEPDMMPPTPPMASPPAPGAQPIETPPPMTMAPAPARAPAPAPAPAPLRPPPGQWVYTQQYGWLYLPYGQAFTQVVDDAALAYAYAYYPAFGWRWVVAPWVLGFGVTPYWGPVGPVRFAWYAHPWFRLGTAHLRPTWGRGMGPHAGIRAMGRFGGGGHGHR